MTMMVHKLVRLTGNEAWGNLGDDWESQLDVVCNLSFVRGWSITPGSVSRTRKERALDWGARLYEVSKAELLELMESRPDDFGTRQKVGTRSTRISPSSPRTAATASYGWNATDLRASNRNPLGISSEPSAPTTEQ